MAFSKNCFIIGITGGKGGVGKSVFSANLATALAKGNQKTLLIDFDKNSGGDHSIILGSHKPTSIGKFSESREAISSNNLNQLIKPTKQGLYYLSSVMNIEESFFVNNSSFLAQLSRASHLFKYIIFDLGSDLGAEQTEVMTHLSCIIMVTNPDILTLNQTKKIKSKIISSGVPSSALFLALNKVGRSGMTMTAIQNSLRSPVIGSIPLSEQTINNSIQTGTPFIVSQPSDPSSLAIVEIIKNLNSGLLAKVHAAKKSTPSQHAPIQKEKTSTEDRKTANPLRSLKIQIHNKLIENMDIQKDLANNKGSKQKEDVLRNKVKQFISQAVDSLGSALDTQSRNSVIKEVLDESLGLGPLEDLLSDKNVSEIMVNGCDQIFIERSGRLTLSPTTFTSNLHLRTVIERVCAPLGRRIDEKTPYVDARLADGSRVNAIIEPLSIDGPALTIRKFPSDTISMSDYVDRFHSLTKPMGVFLKLAVSQGLNIIISGGTGSGKTTLLNVLSSFIPKGERIITVEDAAELQLKQDHVVRLETRPPNIEGEGGVEIRDLIRNSLRMRPDRIVVGECRDGAALDMLSAMNTGHDGSMTTVHANNPREGIARLETLCMMAGMDLPAKAIREQIAGAVNLIIQISRLSDGSRKIMSITEVVGMQGDVVTLQEIYKFKETGFDANRKIQGVFQSLGIIPSCVQDFEKKGIKVPRELFSDTGATQKKVGKPSPTKSNSTSYSGKKTTPSLKPLKKVGT